MRTPPRMDAATPNPGKIPAPARMDADSQTLNQVLAARTQAEITAVDEMEDDETESRKRLQRHTPEQIRILEDFFKNVNPRPGEKDRQWISQKTNLAPDQVRYWFQNKRTHEKNVEHRKGLEKLRTENQGLLDINNNQHQKIKGLKEEIAELRKEINDLRRENQRLVEINNGRQHHVNIQHEEIAALRKEKTDLRDEINAAKVQLKEFLSPFKRGAASSEVDSAPPKKITKVAMNSMNRNAPFLAPKKDGWTLFSENISKTPVDVAELMKSDVISLYLDKAKRELLMLCDDESSFWKKQEGGSEEFLIEKYKMFYGSHRATGKREISKAVEIIPLGAEKIVEVLMSKSMEELFPTMVLAKGKNQTLQKASTEHNGSVLLVKTEFHPLVPMMRSRDFQFLRYCEKLSENNNANYWIIVDFVIDILYGNAENISVRRYPSGCFIKEDTRTACCQVTWLEHVVVEADESVEAIFQGVYKNCSMFSARRWLNNLRKYFDLEATMEVTDDNPTEGEKNDQRIVRLAQKMTNNFIAGLVGSNKHRWMKAIISHAEDSARTTLKTDTLGIENKGYVVCCAKSYSVPVERNILFRFLADIRNRSKWDVLSNRGVRMIKHQNLLDNCFSVSLLESYVDGAEPQFVLLDKERDALVDMLVYAPVQIPGNGLLTEEFIEQENIYPFGLLITEVSPSECVLTVSFQIEMDPHIKELDSSHITELFSTVNATAAAIRRHVVNAT